MDAIKRVEAGLPIPELCRDVGISTASFCKWRAKFGGIDTSMMARMKELEEENRRLEKMYIEEKLKAEIAAEYLEKKVRQPSRREVAKEVVSQRGISIRLACHVFTLSESCYRFESKRSAEDEQIANWLVRLTDNNRSWGFGLCYLYLCNVKAFKWNYKRV